MLRWFSFFAASTPKLVDSLLCTHERVAISHARYSGIIHECQRIPSDGQSWISSGYDSQVTRLSGDDRCVLGADPVSEIFLTAPELQSAARARGPRRRHRTRSVARGSPLGHPTPHCVHSPALVVVLSSTPSLCLFGSSASVRNRTVPVSSDRCFDAPDRPQHS